MVDIAINGTFQTPMRLYKEKPGIYTVVAWIMNNKSEEAFPATAVCIRGE
jgi:hypothetical protein